MDIVYDISALGVNPNYLQTRTGVFRVVENLAAGLSSSSECNLRLCATDSFQQLNRALNYVKSGSNFQDVPFIMPDSEKVRSLAIRASAGIDRINQSDRVSFSSKVMRRLFFHTLTYLEKYHHFRANRFPERGIFHSPFFALPDRSKLPVSLKRFLTVHDILPIVAPQFFKHDNDHFLHRVIESLKPDDWVMCISETTKSDLCNHLRLDPARVFVAHPAASRNLFHTVGDAKELTRVRGKYGIPEAPYLLSLSTLEPRKNIQHAIRCFARTVQEEKLNDLRFVLVGPKGWDYSSILDAIPGDSQIRNRIIMTGYVEDEDLSALYSGALAFVYMSLFEGFGLPPLEAMQCGVPVITSNTSSLPEVVGEAGIMLDPGDEDGLCQAILEVYEKPCLRQTLTTASLKRAKLFSWEKCTRQTIDAYSVAFEN